jgi:hypothetical protein
VSLDVGPGAILHRSSPVRNIFRSILENNGGNFFGTPTHLAFITSVIPPFVILLLGVEGFDPNVVFEGHLVTVVASDPQM